MNDEHQEKLKNGPAKRAMRIIHATVPRIGSFEEGIFMQKRLAALALCVLPILVVGKPISCEDDANSIGDFIAAYHRNPAPARVPEMLTIALKMVNTDALRSRFMASEDFTLLANVFGYMGKDRVKLVRHYEARFIGAGKHGKQFLLEALRICGDADTVKRMRKWAEDPRNAELKKEIESARMFLADPKRAFVRDRPAKSPEDFDLLWADFLVTGEYAPISRTLNALEAPRSLRGKLEKRLGSPLPDPIKGPDVIANLRSYNLLEPNTKDKLVKGDLELVMLYDRKGRLRGDGLVLVAIAQDALDLKDEILARDIAFHGAASRSLQSRLDNPQLAKLLKKHYRKCKPRSQELVKRWLKIDQQFQLSKEAKQLQGTWQAVARQEDGDADDATFVAATLKYVRWTFDEDECSMTKAWTYKTKVIRQGLTNVSTYEIDANHKPHKIVFTSTGGDDWTNTYPCIYKLEGDVLTVCMSKGKHCPKSFSAKSGTNCIVTTLKKVKAQQPK